MLSNILKYYLSTFFFFFILRKTQSHRTTPLTTLLPASPPPRASSAADTAVSSLLTVNSSPPPPPMPSSVSSSMTHIPLNSHPHLHHRCQRSWWWPRKWRLTRWSWPWSHCYELLSSCHILCSFLWWIFFSF